MFDFIKRLEKQVFAAVILVLFIVILTLGGIGGNGKNPITAMAKTPASFGEIETSVKYGQQVVGYLLTQNIYKQREAAKASLARVRDEKEHLEREQLKAQEKHGPETMDNAIILSPEDYQILLKIVEAEAGICDEKGKILVANVILNRMESDEFPDSVKEVVYQPSQFSPVANGSINTCKVSSETIKSVDRALKGEDYSQGALFFMNRSASKGGAVRWFDGRLTYLFRHGSHEFFK